MSPAVADTSAYVQELALIEAELTRRRWLADPRAWAKERIGIDLWSKQVEIMLSVVHNRETIVTSCHEAGKSFTAALTICWFLDCHPVGDAFVVTSAPSGSQVKAILWREIRKLHDKGLRGRVNQTEYYMENVNGSEELVAFGRKPDDYNPTAFQGIHARRVLIVWDEANGIPTNLWEAGDSLIANDNGRMLAIGNPDDPESEFEKRCRPGTEANVIQISAFDAPAFTGEPVPPRLLEVLVGRLYVELKRKSWAKTWYWVDENGQLCDWRVGVRVVPPADEDEFNTAPFWQSKVLGRFPRNATENTLIPMSWIRAAQQRTLERTGPREAALDVGGGGDSSTIAERYGPVVRITHEDHDPDTMHTCGVMMSMLEGTKWDPTPITKFKVDMIGIGRGVVDRAQEILRSRGLSTKRIVGINVGKSFEKDTANFESKKEQKKPYFNLRSQLAWNLRTLFEQGLIDIDPADEELEWQLGAIKFERTSSGAIKLESKKEMMNRLKCDSPNRFDAVMLCFAEKVAMYDSGTWGR